METPHASTMADSFTVARAGRTIERKNSGSIPTPFHAASACLRAEMAAARLARSSGVWRGSRSMQASQRTRWRSVTAPPQSGHTHAVGALLCGCEPSGCALAAARALRAFTRRHPPCFDAGSVGGSADLRFYSFGQTQRGARLLEPVCSEGLTPHAQFSRYRAGLGLRWGISYRWVSDGY